MLPIHWEPLYTKIAIAVVLLLFVISPIKFLRWIWKLVSSIVCFPYRVWRWRKNKRLLQTRQRNYKLLGNYVAVFAGHPDVLRYLRTLIENDTPEQEFQILLANNLKNLQMMEFELRKKELQLQLQEELNIKQIATQQQELLVESKMSLEQIKFREQLLDKLYQKIKEKYELPEQKHTEDTSSSSS